MGPAQSSTGPPATGRQDRPNAPPGRSERPKPTQDRWAKQTGRGASSASCVGTPVPDGKRPAILAAIEPNGPWCYGPAGRHEAVPDHLQSQFVQAGVEREPRERGGQQVPVVPGAQIEVPRPGPGELDDIRELHRAMISGVRRLEPARDAPKWPSAFRAGGAQNAISAYDAGRRQLASEIRGNRVVVRWATVR